MSIAPLGIHHVTAIATDPQRNADFYHVTLGLRLIKRTVNFDSPDTYHLYYGDEAGHPGTLITFFPWPGTPRGRRGTGQATSTSFSVPPASLGWWTQRLEQLGVEVAKATTRFDEDVLSFHDPDGLAIELIASADAAGDAPWPLGPVPVDHQIRGLHGVTLSEAGYEATAELLVDRLGFQLIDEAKGRFRFETGPGGPGTRVDVVCQPEAPRGLVAAGTVHHVAWRAPDRDTQADWRGELVGTGLNVTPIIDRQYFESIYFREPGGVLLEIATDPPGFTKDEPLLELGRSLKLPPWLEPQRDVIQQALPQLRVPEPEAWAEQGTTAGE